MEFDKLCSVGERASLLNPSDTTRGRRAVNEFFAEGRVVDTADVRDVMSRKGGFDRILDSIDYLGLDIEDVSYLKGVITQVGKYYNGKLTKIQDSLQKVKAESASEAEKFKKVQDSLESNVAVLKKKIEILEGSLDERKERLGKVMDSLDTSNKKLKVVTDSIEQYKVLGTVEELKKKIADAEYVLQDKQQAEEQRQQEEQRRQQEEEQRRQQEEQLKQQQEQLKQQEEQLKQQQEEMQRQEEERKRQQEEVEKQRQAQQTVTVNDSKSYKIKHRVVREPKVSDSLADATEDQLKQLATLFEDFIQTGSQYVAERLKTLTSEINDPSLTELVNKITSYEGIESTAYEDLTAPLKEALSSQGLSIPSLALIADSENWTGQLEAYRTIPVSEVCLCVQNYAQAPNHENLSKLNDIINKMPEGKFKEQLANLNNYFSASALAELLKKIKGFAKQDEEVDLTIVPVTEVPVLVQTADQVIENNIAESVLSHNDYMAVSDSQARFNAIAKVTDCCDCCKCCEPCCGTSCEHVPYIDRISPVEGTNFISVVIDNIARIFAPREGISALEAVARVQAVDPCNGQLDKLFELFVPVNEVLAQALALSQYDIVTDSALYKRHLYDKCWVSDTMNREGILKESQKLIRLFDSVKDYNEFVTTVTDSKNSVFRVMVADSKDDLLDPKEFKSIKTKVTNQFEGTRFISLLEG